MIYKDADELGISSLDTLLTLSKLKFKRTIKRLIHEAGFKFLLSEKSKLSKGKELSYSKHEMQNYLKSGNGLTNNESKQDLSVFFVTY